MYFPRNASLILGWLLGAAVASPIAGHAFPSQALPSRPGDAPTSISRLAETMRPRVAELRASLEQNPDQANVLVALGEELEQIGDWSRAVAVYDHALRAHPDQPHAFYGFWHARSHIRAREEDGTSETIGSVDTIDRSDSVEGALEEGRSVAGARQEDVEPETGLGHMSLGAGELEAAIGRYEMALAAHPGQTGVRLNLARALMVKRRWDEARDHLERVVLQRPDWAEAHYALGLVKYSLNDVRGSIEAYDDALRANPGEALAHFQLGLLLRMNGREVRGFRHLLEAARRGVPQAQYLVGAAYRSGRGVSPDPGQAIAWWFRAADQGLPAARERLSRLRLEAVRGLGAESLRAAFRSYRESLWESHADRGPTGPGRSVGVRLLQEGRVREALPMLIREAKALSFEAHRVLEVLYEVGFGGALDAHDARILAFLEETADEGLPRSRFVLGRIYFEGLGVSPDRDRARRLFGSPWSDAIAKPHIRPPVRPTWLGRNPLLRRSAVTGAGLRESRILR